MCQGMRTCLQKGPQRIGAPCRSQIGQSSRGKTSSPEEFFGRGAPCDVRLSEGTALLLSLLQHCCCAPSRLCIGKHKQFFWNFHIYVPHPHPPSPHNTQTQTQTNTHTPKTQTSMSICSAHSLPQRDPVPVTAEPLIKGGDFRFPQLTPREPGLIADCARQAWVRNPSCRRHHGRRNVIRLFFFADAKN